MDLVLWRRPNADRGVQKPENFADVICTRPLGYMSDKICIFVVGIGAWPGRPRHWSKTLGPSLVVGIFKFSWRYPLNKTSVRSKQVHNS